MFNVVLNSWRNLFLNNAMHNCKKVSSKVDLSTINCSKRFFIPKNSPINSSRDKWEEGYFKFIGGGTTIGGTVVTLDYFKHPIPKEKSGRLEEFPHILPFFTEGI
jgi:hypothetical protein